jgi:YD repeat-containing protein
VRKGTDFVRDLHYDDEGRLVEDVTKDAAGITLSTERYAYTSASEWTRESSGRPGDEHETYRFEHGRLVTDVVAFANGVRLTTTFQYAPSGQLAHEDALRERPGHEPEHGSARYEYDTAGRLLRRVSLGNEFEYVYGSDGAVDSVRYHGVLWNFRRDARGRIVDVLEASRPFMHFDYDAAGRLTAVNGSDRYAYEYECQD